jgi:hypothetical protein
MFPFIPLVIASLAGGAYLKVRSDKRGIMTPERQQIYDAALTNLKDPIKLRSLADGFEKEGFRAQAELLRKRAVLRELSPTEREQRKKIFDKTMSSTNTKVMEQIAALLDEQGATGAAANIRLRINILENQAILGPKEETQVEEVIETAAEVKEETTVEKEVEKEVEKNTAIPFQEGNIQRVIINSPNYVVEDHRPSEVKEAVETVTLEEIAPKEEKKSEELIVVLRPLEVVEGPEEKPVTEEGSDG